MICFIRYQLLIINIQYELKKKKLKRKILNNIMDIDVHNYNLQLYFIKYCYYTTKIYKPNL